MVVTPPPLSMLLESYCSLENPLKKGSHPLPLRVTSPGPGPLYLLRSGTTRQRREQHSCGHRCSAHRRSTRAHSAGDWRGLGRRRSRFSDAPHRLALHMPRRHASFPSPCTLVVLQEPRTFDASSCVSRWHTILRPRQIDRGAPAAQSRRLPAAVSSSAVLGRRACCSPRAWVALSAGRAGPCVIAHRPGAIEPRSGYSRRDVRSSCVREKTCGDGFTRKDWSAHGLRLRRLESGPAPNPGGAAAPHPAVPDI